jgi:hypothetical protein
MKVNKSTRDFLIRAFKESKISLEGNILKVIESDPEDLEFIESPLNQANLRQAVAENVAHTLYTKVVELSK